MSAVLHSQCGTRRSATWKGPKTHTQADRMVFSCALPPSSHLHTRSVFMRPHHRIRTQDPLTTLQCLCLARPTTAPAVAIPPDCLRELPPWRFSQFPPCRRAANHSSRRGANHSSRRGAMPPTTTPAVAPTATPAVAPFGQPQLPPRHQNSKAD